MQFRDNHLKDYKDKDVEDIVDSFVNLPSTSTNHPC